MKTQNYIDYPKTHPLKHVNQTDTQRVRHRHRNRILIQLEEVYSSALENGSYPSALKAVALNIKMLTLMESPKAAIGLSDLNTESLGKLLQDIDDEYGDLSPTRVFPEFAKPTSPDLDRKSAHRYDEERRGEVPPLPEETSVEDYESLKYCEEPEEQKIKEPPQFQHQTPPLSADKSPSPNLSSLDKNITDNKIAELDQMEAADSSPQLQYQLQSQNSPQSGGNSAFTNLASLGTEGIKRLIKEIDEQLGEDSPLRTIPEFAAHREEICGPKSVHKSELVG